MALERTVLLIISGGIAAYKSLELIRRLRDQGTRVRCVLTAAGKRFVTPLSVAAVSENTVYEDLFSLTDEVTMGHIRLSREADLLVVAPCTADLMARMAAGMADDLASTVLLATNKPVLLAPSMNTMMWYHAATQANRDRLLQRGIHMVGPNSGDLACGEVGPGRMADVSDILESVDSLLSSPPPPPPLPPHDGCEAPDTLLPLKGRSALVTSGPTHEPIDPVRMIANRSSGKQGHAVAASLAALGADVTLVSGPVTLAPPAGVRVIAVETAREMLAACTRTQDDVRARMGRPLDMAVCVAAVADWAVDDVARQKLKKTENETPLVLHLRPNPDILATIAIPSADRPRLVIGFAAETDAETDNVIAHARAKRQRKHCDWMCANDVSADSGTFGGDDTTLHVIRRDSVDTWPRLSKIQAAQRLADAIAAHFSIPERVE